MPRTDPELNRQYGREYKLKHRLARWAKEGLPAYKSTIWDHDPKIDFLSESEKSWLAAVLDCEGTIYLITQRSGRPYFQVHLQVCNTNLELLQRVQTLIGGNVATRNNPGLGKKPCWWFRLNGFGSVLQVLHLLLPYLIVKTERAKLAIEFLEYRKSTGSYFYGDHEKQIMGRIKTLIGDQRENRARLFY